VVAQIFGQRVVVGRPDWVLSQLPSGQALAAAAAHLQQQLVPSEASDAKLTQVGMGCFHFCRQYNLRRQYNSTCRQYRHFRNVLSGCGYGVVSHSCQRAPTNVCVLNTGDAQQDLLHKHLNHQDGHALLLPSRLPSKSPTCGFAAAAVPAGVCRSGGCVAGWARVQGCAAP
jgi:hypothetical protein